MSSMTTMSRQAAVDQALATSCAAIIAFIGVCHEFVGAALFPWGPDFFGGAIGWHAIGVFAIASGLLAMAGTLHLMRVPIPLLSMVAVGAGAAIAVATAVLHGQFHMFAIAVALAGFGMTVFHRRAMTDHVRLESLREGGV
jgi:hypothetical protein